MKPTSSVGWLVEMTRHPEAHYSVPPGPLLAMIMAATSSLCGANIKYERPGKPPRSALLSTTFVSPDRVLPAWIDVEWSNLLSTSPAAMYVTEKIERMPKVAAARRRKRKLMEFFDCSGAMSESEVFSLMTGRNVPRGFGTIRWYGRKFNPADELRPVSLTHMAAGYPQVRKALEKIPAEAAKRERHRDMSLFWLKPREFQKLSLGMGRSGLDRFGLVLGLAEASAEIPPANRLPAISDTIMRVLGLTVRHNINSVPFRPCEAAAENLDAHEERVLKLMECPGGKDLVPDLGWRLASLIHAACHPAGQQNEERDRSTMALALPLAEWMTLTHLSTMGRLIPSDQKGRFEGDELRIIRTLGETPASMRDIQRTLRGIHQPLIVPTVERSVQAGLVIRHPDGRCSLPPRPEIDLSEVW